MPSLPCLPEDDLGLKLLIKCTGKTDWHMGAVALLDMHMSVMRTIVGSILLSGYIPSWRLVIK